MDLSGLPDADTVVASPTAQQSSGAGQATPLVERRARRSAGSLYPAPPRPRAGPCGPCIPTSLGHALDTLLQEELGGARLTAGALGHVGLASVAGYTKISDRCRRQAGGGGDGLETAVAVSACVTHRGGRDSPYPDPHWFGCPARGLRP